MKFLVTGGNGFIGRAFCEEAKARGHETFVVDKNAPFPVDLANGTALNNMVAKCQPDWVIHLAATPGTGNGKDDVGAAAMQDVFNTRNLLQAMQLAGCKRILFASTGSVYADSSLPLDEESATGPKGFYAAGKLACEGFIQAWCEANEGTGVALRLGTIIGPGNNKGLIKDFVRKMRNGPAEIQIMGDGMQVKSYLHVNDLARAMSLATLHEQRRYFKVYNVGHEQPPLNVAAVAGYVATALGVPRPLLITSPAPFGDMHRIDLDVSRIRNLTWKPVLSIGEAITQNVQWLLDHPEVFE